MILQVYSEKKSSSIFFFCVLFLGRKRKLQALMAMNEQGSYSLKKKDFEGIISNMT